MHKLFESRVAAVAVGAAVIVGLGSTSAVAARLIDSDDIRNNSIRSEDINRNAVSSAELGQGAVLQRHLDNGAVGINELSAFVQNQVDDKGEITGLRHRVDALETEVTELGDSGPSNTIGHLLHGTPTQTTTITYEFDEPVLLSDLTTSGALSFFQERVFGAGDYGASILLGVDVDGSGGYESDDRAWGTAPDPAALGDDTFVAMDGADPDTVKVDAPTVNRWWTPNQAGDGFETVDANCYNTLATLVDECQNVRFDADSTVELLRFTIGGTVAWQDEAVRVTLLDDRLALVTDETDED